MGAGEECIDVVDLKRGRGHLRAEEKPEVLEPLIPEGAGLKQEFGGGEKGVRDVVEGVEEEEGWLEVISEAVSKGNHLEGLEGSCLERKRSGGVKG